MRLLRKNKLMVLSLILVFFISSGFSCKSIKPVDKTPIDLTIWGVIDDSSDFQELLASYKSIHPNINVTYKKFRPEEYEMMLLNGWAEDRGPDIFAIKDSWLGKYKSKITPMPDKINMTYIYQKDVFAGKKEEVAETRPTSIPNLKDLKDSYVKAVYDEILLPDASSNKKVYGLPLFVDTLALYYNQSLLENAGIVFPPKNWEEFNEQVQKITKFNQKNEIVQPAAAIGASKNIKHSFDLLSLLMMQNGTIMAQANNLASFDRPTTDKGYYPGETASVFYTDFAQPTKQVYTWNETFPMDLDAFRQNQVAFFFGYNEDLAYIKDGAPKLNFAVAPLPQVNESVPVNFASFWLQTVSFKSNHTNEAWDFILYFSQKDNLKKYLDKTKKPTPLKAFIEEQSKDIELSAFTSQLLTAQNWYRGKNYEVAQGAFNEIIDKILEGEGNPRQAISTAAQKINQTY